MSKPKTLERDDIEVYSLRAILNCYGGLIARNPANAAKWLKNLPIKEADLVEFPTLARLLTSNIIVVNFAPPAQAKRGKQAA